MVNFVLYPASDTVHIELRNCMLGLVTFGSAIVCLSAEKVLQLQPQKFLASQSTPDIRNEYVCSGWLNHCHHSHSSNRLWL